MEIRLENTQKAMYLKSIEISYQKLEEPELPSGVGTVEGQEPRAKSQKLLIDGQLYIIHNGQYYNILGNKISK